MPSDERKARLLARWTNVYWRHPCKARYGALRNGTLEPMRRLPPLTSLEAFIQVARTGSVKAAAVELALSTPALSRRVQSLERYLGLTLFERKHQHMELNADGQRLMEEIAPVLDSLSLAIDSALKGGRELRLRLNVMPLFASQRLVPHLPELKKAQPDLHLDIDTGAFTPARLGDGIDASIVLAREVDPTLHMDELERDEIHLLVSRKRQEGPNPVRQPADLASESLLIHKDMPATFESWRMAVGLAELEPRAVEQYDSGQLILEAAAQGLGIAVMHASHLTHANDERLVRLFDVHVESPYRYYFVCRPRALDSRAVRLFRDWLLNAAI